MKVNDCVILILLIFNYVLVSRGCSDSGECTFNGIDFNATCSITFSATCATCWKDMLWRDNKPIASNSAFDVSDVDYHLQCVYKNLSVAELGIKRKFSPDAFSVKPRIYIIESITKTLRSITVFWKNENEKILSEVNIKVLNEWKDSTIVALMWNSLIVNSSTDVKSDSSETTSIVERSVPVSNVLWDYIQLSTADNKSLIKNGDWISIPNDTSVWYRLYYYSLSDFKNVNSNAKYCAIKTLEDLIKDFQSAVKIKAKSFKIVVKWILDECHQPLVRSFVIQLCDENKATKCTENVCDQNCIFENLTPNTKFIIFVKAFLRTEETLQISYTVQTTNIKFIEPVRNLRAIFVNSSQITISWDPPKYLPNEPIEYFVYYGDDMLTREHFFLHITKDTSFSLTENVAGYVAYTFEVSYCIINVRNCSPEAEVSVDSSIGNPTDIQHTLKMEVAESKNNVMLSWDYPEVPNGPVDYYLVSYSWKINGNHHYAEKKVNETHLKFIPICKSEVHIIFKFHVKAINVNSTMPDKSAKTFKETTLCQNVEGLPIYWISIIVTCTAMSLCLCSFVLYLYIRKCTKWPSVVLPEEIIPAVYKFPKNENRHYKLWDKYCLPCCKSNALSEGKPDNFIKVENFRQKLNSDDSGFGGSICQHEFRSSLTSNDHEYEICNSGKDIPNYAKYNRYLLPVVENQESKLSNSSLISIAKLNFLISNPIYICSYPKENEIISCDYEKETDKIQNSINENFTKTEPEVPLQRTDSQSSEKISEYNQIEVVDETNRDITPNESFIPPVRYIEPLRELPVQYSIVAFNNPSGEESSTHETLHEEILSEYRDNSSLNSRQDIPNGYSRMSIN